MIPTISLDFHCYWSEWVSANRRTMCAFQRKTTTLATYSVLAWHCTLYVCELLSFSHSLSLSLEFHRRKNVQIEWTIRKATWGNYFYVIFILICSLGFENVLLLFSAFYLYERAVLERELMLCGLTLNSRSKCIHEHNTKWKRMREWTKQEWVNLWMNPTTATRAAATAQNEYKKNGKTIWTRQ